MHMRMHMHTSEARRTTLGHEVPTEIAISSESSDGRSAIGGCESYTTRSLTLCARVGPFEDTCTHMHMRRPCNTRAVHVRG